jgi:hypothetical protein
MWRMLGMLNCVHMRRLDGATDLDEGGGGAEGAAEAEAGGGGGGREAGGAAGPSGQGEQAAEDASAFLVGEGEDPRAYAARIFRRVFCTDIESVLRMDVRSPPGAQPPQERTRL